MLYAETQGRKLFKSLNYV